MLAATTTLTAASKPTEWNPAASLVVSLWGVSNAEVFYSLRSEQVLNMNKLGNAQGTWGGGGWAVVASCRRDLSLQMEWVAAKDLLNLCQERGRNSMVGQNEAFWTDQSLCFLLFWGVPPGGTIWGRVLVWRRFSNSTFLIPSSPETITWNRGRKTVLANSPVRKTLSLLSGWRAWNRVKNCSNVYFKEDKL